MLLARGGKSFKPWDYLFPENSCFPENFQTDKHAGGVH